MAGCVTVPIALLQDERLSLNDVRLYATLVHFAQGGTVCQCTSEALKNESGIKQLHRSTERLCSCGYVEIRRGANGTSYDLIETADTVQQPGITLKRFAEEYVDRISKTDSDSYTRDAKAAFRNLQKFAGDVPLNELRPIMFDTFFAGSFKRAPFETARNYRTLRAAFNHAIEWDYLSDNPLMKIKLPKLPKPIPSFINEMEFSQILKETKDGTPKDIFLCGFNTGMRLSEMLNLQWNAINFSERTIIVSNTKSFTTKNKKERIIPINDTLLPMLEKRRPKVLSIDGNDLVFGKTRVDPFSVNYIGRKFKESVRKAGLSERLRTHSLRHSFATILTSRGVPITTVKELLGHSNISTTMIYSHVNREDMVNAVKLLEKG